MEIKNINKFSYLINNIVVEHYQDHHKRSFYKKPGLLYPDIIEYHFDDGFYLGIGVN